MGSSLNVAANVLPTVTIIPTPNPVCQNTTLNLSVPSAGGGSSYNWSGSGIVPANANSTTAVPTAAGSQPYAVTVISGATGCSNTGTVNVTVNTAPAFTACPGNQSGFTPPDACALVVSYTATVSGSPAPSVSYQFTGATTGSGSGTGSGSTFQKGVTNVTITAQNPCGTQTCSFTVTVTDNVPPSLLCPTAALVLYTDAGSSCSVTIPDYIASLTPTDNCPGIITETQDIPAGPYTTGVAHGAVFSLHYRATDIANNTKTCTVTFTVNDDDRPNITCPGNQTLVNTPGLCSAQATYTTPTATDNCALAAGQPVWVSGGSAPTPAGSNSVAIFSKGINTVQWRATDVAGNNRTCTFRITVNDTEPPTLNCPADFTLPAAQGLCSAPVTYTNPAFTDNCPPTSGTSVRVSGPVSGSNFPVGVSKVVFQATDAASNTRRCTLTVTVVDTQPPVITCPPPISVTGAGTPCVAQVNYANPTATDNCAIIPLVPFLLTGLSSSSVFPAGVTTNTWQAVAPNGQTSDCSFTITVVCNMLRGSSKFKGLEATDRSSPATLPAFSLFPNPAAQEAWLDLSALEGLPCSVRVLDARGALVQQHPSAQTASGLFRLDLDGVPTGLYFVQVRVPGGVAQVLKLVVEQR